MMLLQSEKGKQEYSGKLAAIGKYSTVFKIIMGVLITSRIMSCLC